MLYTHRTRDGLYFIIILIFYNVRVDQLFVVYYTYTHRHTGCKAGVCMARGDTGRRTLFMAVVIRNIIKRFLDIRYPDDDGATRNGP